MLQVIDTAELAKDAERELWSDYMSTRAFADECRRMVDETWAAYIRTGMEDQAIYSAWRKSSDMWNTAADRACALGDAWRQAAYPLYGLESLLTD